MRFWWILLHVCTIRKLYAYMLSQIRKTSTWVELKIGGDDTPLVEDLCIPIISPILTLSCSSEGLAFKKGLMGSPLQHN